MGVVTFNYIEWAARYPELAEASNPPLAGLYFDEATLYLNNSACSMVPADETTGQPRKTILYALTAHIAALNAPLNGQPSSSLVGRITDATEGSVSVSVGGLDGLPGSAAWFSQSKYGLSAWAMMAPYRTARYQSSPGRFAQIPGNGYGYGPYGYGYRQ